MRMWVCLDIADQSSFAVIAHRAAKAAAVLDTAKNFGFSTEFSGREGDCFEEEILLDKPAEETAAFLKELTEIGIGGQTIDYGETERAAVEALKKAYGETLFGDFEFVCEG